MNRSLYGESDKRITAIQGFYGISMGTLLVPQGFYGVGSDQVVALWGQSIKGGGYYGSRDTQAVQGGGSYGVFDAQSIKGGGSVSGVPARQSYGVSTPGGTWTGLFVKVASLPAGDTTLFDVANGAGYYHRCKLTSAGHIVAEFLGNGYTLSVDLTPSTPIVPGSFYWVATAASNAFPAGGIILRGQVTSSAGATDGLKSASNTSATGTTTTYTCILGLGTTQSSGYANFPFAAGSELSKFQYASLTTDNATSLDTVPANDVSPSGLTALYLCRGTVGTSTCNDSTSNAYNLTPGPNGLTVVADGPYP